MSLTLLLLSLDIEREEFKVKTQIKQLAKRGDTSGARYVELFFGCLSPIFRLQFSAFSEDLLCIEY